MAVVKVTSRLIVKKNILPQVANNIRKLDGFVTKVGYPSDGEVGTPLKVGLDPPLTKMSDIAAIAAKLEFGPVGLKKKSWPFMTQAFAEGVNDIKKLVRQVYPRILDGTLPARRALSEFGELHESQIKETIRRIVSPKLEPETVDLKNSAKPLIDTGLMLQSTTHTEEKR